MTCKEARKFIIPFIKDELSMEDTREFLEHVKNCKACMDELEIYYIVEKFDKSDEENIDYNLTESLKGNIREAYQRIFIIFMFKVFIYAVDTLMIFGVIVMTLMQLRIWFF